MFNWATAPTFAVMLLFLLLATYILTRSPRHAVSLAAVGAAVAAAAYLLGQGMQANATTADQWRGWNRDLYWGAIVAPVLWYGLTVLLLREQAVPRLRTYLRMAGYPLLAVIGVLGVACLAAAYAGDRLFLWSAPIEVQQSWYGYSHYHLAQGPLYPAFAGLLLIATLASALNIVLGWRWTRDPVRRACFAWLAVSAALFIAGANTLGIASASSVRLAGDWAIVPSHLILGAGILAMTWNVAAYSLLLRGGVIRRDALYFLTSLVIVLLAYTTLFVALTRGAYNFHVLEAVVTVLILVVVSHALIDVGRRALDPLFFSREVRQLRSDLTDAAQEAALTTDLGGVLQAAREDLEEISMAHFVRLTEEALRRLNAPAGLAGAELLVRLPRTLGAAALAGNAGAFDSATPLQRAHLLRETLLAAIERLRPSGDFSPSTPAALQYEILRQEYVAGLPNKQIMTRLGVSESTFHRNRREAVAAVARELARAEDLRAGGIAGSPAPTRRVGALPADIPSRSRQ